MPHPIVWLILYIPYGALGGFVSIALAFSATQHGLSIMQGSLIVASKMLISWLKWLWAPIVDVTLSPKRWYLIATSAAALGVVAMATIPLGQSTLALLLLVVALSNLANTVVGMAVEAMIVQLTERQQIGKVSAWFQAGNLGGAGFGGALGLFLMQHFTHSWMAGAIVGGSFMLCCAALFAVPRVHAHVRGLRAVAAVREVSMGISRMLKTPRGFLTAFLCVLPVACGAAQDTLTQAAVAAHWGAGAAQVELVQGVLAGLLTAIGCFVGGWFCDRMDARRAYVVFGLLLAAIALAMAVSPQTIAVYVGMNMAYAFAVGLSYAAFTAMVLHAIGKSPAATGYNFLASLSNFPIWWMGLLLGWVAEHHGPANMLLVEAAVGALGIACFIVMEFRRRDPSLILAPAK